MIKILFVIHDLGHGGAEKVLVNLVNNLDKDKFAVTVVALFGGGVNEKFLHKDIRFKTLFPYNFHGNSQIMKIMTPKQLHRFCIIETYDIEVSYLEGPAARIVSGCTNPNTKLVSWIHVEQHNMKKAAYAFRNAREAQKCYSRFDQTICVSEFVCNDFQNIFNLRHPCAVLYNTVESAEILRLSLEKADELTGTSDSVIKLIAVGSLKPSKGYDRLLRIICRLIAEKYPIHLYILGEGNEKENIERYLVDNNISNQVTLLGYQTNPYKYVKKCDLFVCSSHAEGFSTAVTESLIVGTPVCTVEVSGMKELLGENDEFGVVTKNDELALYQGIKELLDYPDKLAHYAKQAALRGKYFSTENTVKAVEKMLTNL